MKLPAVQSSDKSTQEILTMKSGAVQNSPKDKSIPEPGPWSQVQFYFLLKIRNAMQRELSSFWLSKLKQAIKYKSICFKFEIAKMQ